MVEIQKSIDVDSKKLEEGQNSLENINKQINTLKVELEKVDEGEKAGIESKIQELEEKKQSIIAKTKSELGVEKADKKISSEDKKLLGEEIKKIDLPSDEKDKIIEKLAKAKSSNDLTDNENIFGEGIEGLFLKFLAFLTGFKFQKDNTNGNNNTETTFEYKGEIPSSYEDLLKTSEGKKFEKYSPMILKYAKQFDIEPEVILKLYIKEGSHGNILEKSTGSALGLGQITDGTWNQIVNSLAKNYIGTKMNLKRNDAESQIVASMIYLKYCAELRGVSNDEAIIYYHTGPGKITDKRARLYLEQNPAIARIHGNKPATSESYITAAKIYYDVA